MKAQLECIALCDIHCSVLNIYKNKNKKATQAFFFFSKQYFGIFCRNFSASLITMSDL